VVREHGDTVRRGHGGEQRVELCRERLDRHDSGDGAGGRARGRRGRAITPRAGGAANVRTVSSWSNSFATQGTQVVGVTTAVGDYSRLTTANVALAATGAQTTTATFSATQDHPSGLIATYKAAAGGGGVTVKKLAALGVG
jgi:hypothetical protein